MPGWLGVGRLARGLFTVKSRLQLRCGWCPPHGWLGLRGFRRGAAGGCIAELPCRCWLVVSWFVQAWCSVGCYRSLVGFVMVELSCSVVFVGMVVGRRGPSWCRQSVGGRSRFDPCMPGQFGVGRLACGLFMVTSCPVQWFCWCVVVLAASWSACLALVPWRCSGRLRSWIFFV